MRLNYALGTWLLFLVVASPAAFAQTKHWDIDTGNVAGAGGTNPSGLWNAANLNWNSNASGTGIPSTWTAGNTAVFAAGSDATGTYNVTVSGTQSLAGLTVEEGTVTQLGGTLDFGTTANAQINIAAGSTWIKNVQGTFSGTGGLVKAGPGTLEFQSKTNNYSKTGSGNQAFLTILDGAVVFADERELGAVPTASDNAAALTINGGTLRLDGLFNVTLATKRGVFIGANGGTFDVPNAVILALPASAPVAAALGGSGAITKTGIGRFQLNTSQTTFAGKYVVKAGSLSFSTDGVFGAVPAAPQANYFTLDGGAIRTSVTTFATINANRGITVGQGGGTLIGPIEGLSYAGVISGTQGGGLTIALHDAVTDSNTFGVVSLTGANTYDGPTQIESGMRLSTNLLANGGSNSAIGKSSNAAGNLIFNGGTLRYTGPAVSTDRSFTLTTAGGTIETLTGSTSPLAFTSTAPIEFTGSGPHTLVLRGISTANNLLSLQIGDATGGATSLSKSDSGTWVVANTGNNYTGNTTISGGNLKLGAPGVIPDSSLIVGSSSGALNLNGFDETVRSVSGGGIISLGSNTLTLDKPNGETFAGLISSTGGRIAKNGTGSFALNESNSWTGGVTLNGGALGIVSPNSLGNGAFIVNGSARLGSTASSVIMPTNPVTLNGDLTFDDTFSASPAGISWFSSGSNAWTITGGTRSIGVDTAAGGYTVNINQPIGEDAPGRGLTKAGNGTLTLSGVNTYTGDTIVQGGTLRIFQPSLADAADVYLASGTTLSLSFAAGTPDVVDSLFINGVSQATGTWGPLGSGAMHESIFFAGTGMLYVTTLASPVPGDFNRNGAVDAGDYVIWRKNNGTNNALANDNGLGTPVGQPHYGLWRSKFGNTVGSGDGSAAGKLAAVPEPCSAIIGLGSLLGGYVSGFVRKLRNRAAHR